MFKKRIISSLLVAVMMLALLPMTSVFADEALPTDITWELISNGQIQANVTENLNLVKVVNDEGTERTVIWTSSKPEVLNTDGVVTRWDKDEAVTLIGTFGGRVRTYNIIVSSYDSGNTTFRLKNLNANYAYQNAWNTAPSADGGNYTNSGGSPMIWKYDAENNKLYTETQFGTWNTNYNLVLNGHTYAVKDLSDAEVSAGTYADYLLSGTTKKVLMIDGVAQKTEDVKSVTFTEDVTTYSSKTATVTATNYTFYYIDEDLVDADNSDKPYRVGVCRKDGSTSIVGWLSLYVDVDADTGAISVDVDDYDYSVGLMGYIKPDFKPVTAPRLYRSHLNLVGNGWSYTNLLNTTEGIDRFSFRYRQEAPSDKMRGEPEFSFFCNNQSYEIHSQYGPGWNSNTYRYYGGGINVYYTDALDSAYKFAMGSTGYGNTNGLLGSASEPLSVKTSADGLSAFTPLTGGNYWKWVEVAMETNRTTNCSVMYINGQPVYWKGTVDGVTYYSPFIITVNPVNNSADNLRTGFATPFTEKLHTNYTVDSVRIERITSEQITAAATPVTVNSIANGVANIDFTRKGAYAVIFADFDAETGAFIDASYVPVTVTAAGAQDVAATKVGEWDKVFVWRSTGSAVPVIDSIDIAAFNVPEAE